jgi:ribosomal protein L33
MVELHRPGLTVSIPNCFDIRRLKSTQGGNHHAEISKSGRNKPTAININKNDREVNKKITILLIS